MEAVEKQKVETYFKLLKNLGPEVKKELINKLRNSLGDQISTQKNDFEKSFGMWESSQSAEEIIDELRSGRVNSRKKESFD